MSIYQLKFIRIINYIDSHLDQKLSLSQLSEQGHISKYHFHRLFSAFLGMPLAQYIQLMRLKRAAHQLAFRKQLPISEIAYQASFSNSESFSRAFKSSFGITPSAYRKHPIALAQLASINDKTLIQGLTHSGTVLAQTYQQIDLDVTIVELEEIKLAVYQHKGCPSTLMRSISHFIDWRKAYHTPPSQSATYNLIYDDPEQTPPADFRFDICAQTLEQVKENSFDIINKSIPAGRYAKLRHIGSDLLLGQSIDKLYSQWLPTSGHSLADFPIILQRIAMFPDVPESQAIVDILLPLS